MGYWLMKTRGCECGNRAARGPSETDVQVWGWRRGEEQQQQRCLASQTSLFVGESVAFTPL